MGHEKELPLVRGKYAVGTGMVGPTGRVTPLGSAHVPTPLPVAHTLTHSSVIQRQHNTPTATCAGAKKLMHSRLLLEKPGKMQRELPILVCW